jgi:hypothetical protein
MNEARPNTGSYRDPSGRVFVLGSRLLRTVAPRAAADFEFVRATGVLDRLIAEGSANRGATGRAERLARAFEARYVLQHPKLPFVSYPYEWCFKPIEEVVTWLVGLAPNGIIEFVPKSDPMIQRLLRLREDIFDDYSNETFAQHLRARAKIVRVVEVSATGRRLFCSPVTMLLPSPQH